MADDKSRLIADAEAVLQRATKPVPRQLDPLEAFFLSLLETGRLPNHKDGCPEIVMTSQLLLAARQAWPLRHLTPTALGQFLGEQGLLQHREIPANGWHFPPLAIARANWEKRYGKRDWPLTSPADWQEDAPAPSLPCSP
jgi:hypothetical protein